MKVSMRQRRNSSFQFTVSRGLDADGRQLRDYIEFHGTKTEARKELTRLQAEIDRGLYVSTTHFTLAGFLEEWLTVYGRPNLSPRTFERYAELVRSHIVPALGSVKLQELTPLQVERFYRRSLDSGRINGDGGLSPQTVLYIHRVLHSALQWARRKNLIARNVTDNVDLPRANRPQMHALDEDQTAAVLDLLDGTDLYLPSLVAVSTGVRRGELLALRWADLDMDSLTLSVSRSLQETARDGLSFKAPKNGTSRTVGIPRSLADELKAHRRAQAEHRLSLGVAFRDQGLVFPAVDGSPINPHVFSRKFDRFKARRIAAANKTAKKLAAEGHEDSSEYAEAIAMQSLLDFRWHDWRHSYASQQLRAGEQPLVVSKALGHATVAFTMDVYGHVLPGEQSAAAERHGERIAAARERRIAGASK